MTSSTSPQTSTPTDQSAPRSEPESRKGDWAGGLTVFAGVILIVVGLFQFFQGLAAIVKGSSGSDRRSDTLLEFYGFVERWARVL